MRSKPYLPAKLPSRWSAILSQIPGYDAIATAGDCRFDADAATVALDFFPTHLRHREDSTTTKAGDPFTLQPWQQAIIANLFGWKRADATRRYREAMIYVPRKNGKSMFAAGLALLVLFLDPEQGQQNYLAAGDRDQAGFVFRHARGMIEQSELLSGLCRIYGGNAQAGQSKSIVLNNGQSFLRVISAAGEAAHGGGTHLGIIDELHVQPSRDLVDVILSSRGARRQPLIIYTTTAGTAGPSICNEIHKLACDVRDGVRDLPYFLPVVYETKQEEDWTDEKVWAKCNPNLGVSVSLDFLRDEFQKAKENIAYENTFRRLYLDQVTEQAVRMIPMDKWDACGGDADPIAWRKEALARLKGRPCVGGLDLGSYSDLTAAVFLFGDDDSGYDVLPFFWAPRVNAEKRERRDRVTYLVWAKQGFITLTEGDETDYIQVRADINALNRDYHIVKLPADRLFQGAAICQQLISDGFEVVEFGQTMYWYAAPTRRFLELVGAGKLRHGNNPVLRWMAANVCAAPPDDAGNLMPSKGKSAEKIDGIVGCIMALDVSNELETTGDGGCDVC